MISPVSQMKSGRIWLNWWHEFIDNDKKNRHKVKENKTISIFPSFVSSLSIWYFKENIFVLTAVNYYKNCCDYPNVGLFYMSWWRYQMETFSALLALCVGNSPVTGEFPSQRPVTRSFDVFFDLCQNKRLSKQSWGWWFEPPSRSLWRHCNVM